MKKNARGIILVILIALALGGAYLMKNSRDQAIEKEANNSTEENNVQEDNTDLKAEEKVNEKDSEKAEVDENVDNAPKPSSDVKSTSNSEKIKALDKEKEDFYITSEEQYEKLIKEEKPLFLMFGTKVCPFCNQMRPYVSDISKTYKDRVIIKYVDAQDLPNVAYRYPIKGVPAVMLQNADKSGYTPSDDVMKVLQQNYNEPTAYSFKDSKKHDFTMTYGLLKRELVIQIVEELVGNDKWNFGWFGS